MPIPHYRLDDRSFDDLVRELLDRIPGHTPEWTHPRLGDPGRTLIELFAWLADTLLYRVNLIPERQRLAFLRLLNIPLRPARPARGLIAVELASDRSTQPVAVPVRTLVKGPVRFETRDELSVLPVQGAVYARRKPTDAEKKRLREVVAGLESVYDVKAGQPYITTPLFAAGRAAPAGFDPVTETVDRALWVALLAPTPEALPTVREALGRRSGRSQVLNVGIAPRLTVPEGEEEGTRAERDREVWEWEATSSRTAAGGGPEFLTLRKLLDTTDGFRRNGIVRLELPDSDDLGAPSNDLDLDVYAGVGDRPPRLDDAEQAGRLVTWLRLRARHKPAPLALAWVGVNAVETEQLQTLEGVVVGTATGAGDLTLQLPAASLDPVSLVLQVEEPGAGYVTWQRVPDLALAGRDDRAFLLDPEAGTVTFGDGVRGAVPGTGMRVRVHTLRAGGGATGNLPAGSLTAVGQPGLRAVQPLATTGGADAETLDQAEQRIPAVLRHGDRAVTAEDYRSLALETPGLTLGRVEVLPRFKPHQRRSGVPGVVSVLVMPDATVQQPPNPRPDRLVLERVRQYLDARRPVAAELYVIAPEYVPVAISVAVSLRDGHARDQLLQAVREALRNYLWPLAPGGVDGTGWPLGQAVNAAEIEVAVARVAGVRTVNGVNLFVRQGPPDASRWVLAPPHPETGLRRVELQPWQLPELLAVAAVEGESEAPTEITTGGGTAPDADGTVPIPTVPEVC